MPRLGSFGGPYVTATRPTPVSPDITVKPVNRRPKQLPYPLSIYQSAVGKKWVMALSGIAMMGFIFAHMVGNLKMYLGPVEYDHYSAGLRELLYPILPKEAALWLMRTGLIVALLLHLHSAYSLTVMNRRSRPVAYQSRRDYLAANFASRTMRWSGIIVLAFIGFHILNLTTGTIAAPDFEHGAVYANLVNALSQWWVSAIYIVSNLALGVHLYHGAWSLFQSLGANSPALNAARRYFAIGFTAVVIGLNLTFPIAVLTGVVSLPS
jgi:succinate dehydrogenase / fumarate reductase cytochrome b subunit